MESAPVKMAIYLKTAASVLLTITKTVMNANVSRAINQYSLLVLPRLVSLQYQLVIILNAVLVACAPVKRIIYHLIAVTVRRTCTRLVTEHALVGGNISNSW